MHKGLRGQNNKNSKRWGDLLYRHWILNSKYQPWTVNINAKKLAMTPSILEMTKYNITRLWVEATFSISLSLPEVCKPPISCVKIKPALTTHLGIVSAQWKAHVKQNHCQDITQIVHFRYKRTHNNLRRKHFGLESMLVKSKMLY